MAQLLPSAESIGGPGSGGGGIRQRRLAAKYLGEHWGEPNVIHLG